jgi:hypothetical protein
VLAPAADPNNKQSGLHGSDLRPHEFEEKFMSKPKKSLARRLGKAFLVGLTLLFLEFVVRYTIMDESIASAIFSDLFVVVVVIILFSIAEIFGPSEKDDD